MPQTMLKLTCDDYRKKDGFLVRMILPKHLRDLMSDALGC